MLFLSVKVNVMILAILSDSFGMLSLQLLRLFFKHFIYHLQAKIGCLSAEIFLENHRQ